MAIEPIISWNAPEHHYVDKKPDWYWTVGIITMALAAVAIILGNIITGIFIVVAAVALVLHASRPPRIVSHEINDRGILVGDRLYPFLTLESFWIPHGDSPARMIVKSRKLLMPYIIVLIDEVDAEDVRKVMLKYIAETEHHEHFLTYVLEGFGF